MVSSGSCEFIDSETFLDHAWSTAVSPTASEVVSRHFPMPR
jgi:hypothetical protein